MSNRPRGGRFHAGRMESQFLQKFKMLNFAGVAFFMSTALIATDPRNFRDVLGCCPTSVAVITALNGEDRFGMVVGTFTSISLDPPLVGFFPAKGSSTWSRIAETGRFCANILSAEQAHISRLFSSKAEDKFAEVIHGSSPSGLPLIDGIAAWVDCRIQSVQEIGDHFLVVGAVEAIGQGTTSPLVFLKGGYCVPQSL